MKLVIQRVSEASVTVDNKCLGEIKKGLVVFIGISSEDTKETVERYVDKLLKLRIFSDDMDKTNLSLQDVKGELLLISQFTLYADCKKGNRPNFLQAAPPAYANELYDYFISLCQTKQTGKVASGEFGADMKVALINDGPFTIVLELS